MGGTRIGAASPPATSQTSRADSTQPSSDLLRMRGPESKKSTGRSQKDSFESGKRHIDLFPKDVLAKAAKLTPQQHVNAHLNALKSATNNKERASALRNLRQYLNTLSAGDQAKILTDPKIKSTIQQVIKDPKSPAAEMVKDLLKGTLGDVIKTLQAVKPDISVDIKKKQITSAGVKVDVPKLLNLIKKDYGDIL